MRLSMGDRQAGAATVAAIMAFGVPIVVGFVLVIVTAWVASAKLLGIVEMHDIHGTLWGWLSDRSVYTDKNGRHVVWSANMVPLAWVMGWVTAWFLYEVVEGVGLLVGGFASLARPRKIEIVEPSRRSFGSRD